MANPSSTVDQNILPVQAYFDLQGNFQTFIGQGKPFTVPVSGTITGATITNSTIDSTTIGATTPSTGVFTNIATTTGSISTTPVGATDIANKLYVDTVALGISWKEPAQAATTTNITLSGLQTVDGVALAAGNIVLVKNQTNAAQNGIYVASSGAWSYAPGSTTWSQYVGALIFVDGGGQAGSLWYNLAQPGGTLGTTNMTWSNFSTSGVYTAGTGLTLTGNSFSITNTAVTAGSYGSASSVGTFTVNAQGQLTAASSTSIAIAASQITSGTIGSSLISGSYTGITGVGTLTAGTWNATPIANSYLANSSITINGNAVSLGGSTTVTANTPNSLTINSGGAGASSPATFNGGSAVTISYNTIGAPSTTGTGASGTWGISISGNAATATTATSASSATSATTATNLAGGSTYAVPYQSASGTTAFLSAGTSGNLLMTLGTVAAPIFVSPSSLTVGYATNIAGGTAGALHYQTGSGATSFLALGTSGYVVTAGASAPQYTAQSSLSVGTATNLAGGAASQIPYQTGSGATSFISNGTSGQVLTSNGSSAPTWQTPSSGITITDDTTTNATRYLTFTSATSGSITGENTSSTKLQFNPSTGVITAAFSGAHNGTVGATTPAAGTFTLATSTEYVETSSALSSGTINLNNGNYFTYTVTGSITFAPSNLASSGSVNSFILDLTNGGAYTVTWWSNLKWAGGTAPTLSTSGRDVLGFFTENAGTTWNGFVLGKAMA
jgi:hypothetical protein